MTASLSLTVSLSPARAKRLNGHTHPPNTFTAINQIAMRGNQMNEHIIVLIKQNTPRAQIDPQPNTLIIGARSPETAVVVSDYPYGRRLRCVMRYWLETKKSHGTRLVSQTNNPKRPGLVWNKPHAGTYSQGAVVLHTDQNAHVKERAFTDFNLSTSTVERAETIRCSKSTISSERTPPPSRKQIMNSFDERKTSSAPA